MNIPYTLSSILHLILTLLDLQAGPPVKSTPSTTKKREGEGDTTEDKPARKKYKPTVALSFEGEEED